MAGWRGVSDRGDEAQESARGVNKPARRDRRTRTHVGVRREHAPVHGGRDGVAVLCHHGCGGLDDLDRLRAKQFVDGSTRKREGGSAQKWLSMCVTGVTPIAPQTHLGDDLVRVSGVENVGPGCGGSGGGSGSCDERKRGRRVARHIASFTWVVLMRPLENQRGKVTKYRLEVEISKRSTQR